MASLGTEAPEPAGMGLTYTIWPTGLGRKAHSLQGRELLQLDLVYDHCPSVIVQDTTQGFEKVGSEAGQPF